MKQPSFVCAFNLRDVESPVINLFPSLAAFVRLKKKTRHTHQRGLSAVSRCLVRAFLVAPFFSSLSLLEQDAKGNKKSGSYLVVSGPLSFSFFPLFFQV